MITLEKVDSATLEREAAAAGIELPIEQTGVWSAFQADIEGRTPWGDFLIRRDGELIAVISLIDFETHGYHYLRSMHGPAWVTKPSESDEREVLDALVSTVRAQSHNVVFLRVDTWTTAGTKPVLSTVPYDLTVVIDVTGGDEAILGRMKRRGRRDVRKALRECPAEVADETSAALADFSEYYDVMVETGKRDGFTPAPMSDYADMIRALGADHCRVFAARIENRVVAWSIVTVNGTHAVRYYAGMRNEVMRLHVTDKLLYSECCILGSQGITAYDLMGIGSDFAPSLKGLNEFKTKFTEEITPVAPARDVPVKKGFYTALTLLQALRRKLRSSSK
ncbi:lipid II:glycine glycyltransferase FemX [Bifidobacterium oedipodis]|uniref:Peptidoglycan bridge formation protein FemAB n=1 Tax=Bifidobacterium oedipodis TaxID=2675322 RepID=A0A7Y0EMK3_9BIFI|nr:GNAT family N-acetyltransferase [Bifidobacterium sp. DSM 109957]NMM92978.1 peptidoglycan bridge formation protein FemAB [Bifidobacterium sp. DSM 109957]